MSAPTEEPTPRRLARARREGDSGVSSFAARAVGLLAALAVFPAAVRALISWWTDAMRAAIATAPHADAGAVDFAAEARAVIFLAAPVLLVCAVTTAVASLAQTGGVVSARRIAPDFARIDPLAGLGRLVSVDALVGLVRAAACGLVAIAIVLFELRAHALDIAHVAGRTGAIGPLALALVASTWKAVAFAGVGIAALDLAIANVLWRRRLKMTHEEIRRERRESDGDPQIKEARKRAFEEWLAGAVRIEDASLVVSDGDSLAIALRYRAGVDLAPAILAAGKGTLEAARNAGIRVVIDPELAADLAPIAIGASIPESLYDRVARLLV
ncbi:MAG: EscU/YscU/HrcU family type III secretion system export apparatus switch protein [Polyangiaceae bacterium]